MESKLDYQVFKVCNCCGRRFNLTFRARRMAHVHPCMRPRHDYCTDSKCQFAAGQFYGKGDAS